MINLFYQSHRKSIPPNRSKLMAKLRAWVKNLLISLVLIFSVAGVSVGLYFVLRKTPEPYKPEPFKLNAEQKKFVDKLNSANLKVELSNYSSFRYAADYSEYGFAASGNVSDDFDKIVGVYGNYYLIKGSANGARVEFFEFSEEEYDDNEHKASAAAFENGSLAGTIATSAKKDAVLTKIDMSQVDDAIMAATGGAAGYAGIYKISDGETEALAIDDSGVVILEYNNFTDQPEYCVVNLAGGEDGLTAKVVLSADELIRAKSLTETQNVAQFAASGYNPLVANQPASKYQIEGFAGGALVVSYAWADDIEADEPNVCKYTSVVYNCLAETAERLQIIDWNELNGGTSATNANNELLLDCKTDGEHLNLVTTKATYVLGKVMQTTIVCSNESTQVAGQPTSAAVWQQVLNIPNGIKIKDLTEFGANASIFNVQVFPFEVEYYHTVQYLPNGYILVEKNTKYASPVEEPAEDEIYTEEQLAQLTEYNSSFYYVTTNTFVGSQIKVGVNYLLYDLSGNSYSVSEKLGITSNAISVQDSSIDGYMQIFENTVEDNSFNRYKIKYLAYDFTVIMDYGYDNNGEAVYFDEENNILVTTGSTTFSTFNGTTKNTLTGYSVASKNVFGNLIWVKSGVSDMYYLYDVVSGTLGQDYFSFVTQITEGKAVVYKPDEGFYYLNLDNSHTSEPLTNMLITPESLNVMAATPGYYILKQQDGNLTFVVYASGKTYTNVTEWSTQTYNGLLYTWLKYTDGDEQKTELIISKCLSNFGSYSQEDIEQNFTLKAVEDDAEAEEGEGEQTDSQTSQTEPSNFKKASAASVSYTDDKTLTPMYFVNLGLPSVGNSSSAVTTNTAWNVNFDSKNDRTLYSRNSANYYGGYNYLSQFLSVGYSQDTYSGVPTYSFNASKLTSSTSAYSLSNLTERDWGDSGFATDTDCSVFVQNYNWYDSAHQIGAITYVGTTGLQNIYKNYQATVNGKTYPLFPLVFLHEITRNDYFLSPNSFSSPNEYTFNGTDYGTRTLFSSSTTGVYQKFNRCVVLSCPYGYIFLVTTNLYDGNGNEIKLRVYGADGNYYNYRDTSQIQYVVTALDQDCSVGITLNYSKLNYDSSNDVTTRKCYSYYANDAGQEVGGTLLRESSQYMRYVNPRDVGIYDTDSIDVSALKTPAALMPDYTFGTRSLINIGYKTALYTPGEANNNYFRFFNTKFDDMLNKNPTGNIDSNYRSTWLSASGLKLGTAISFNIEIVPIVAGNMVEDFTYADRVEYKTGADTAALVSHTKLRKDPDNVNLSDSHIYNKETNQKALISSSFYVDWLINSGGHRIAKIMSYGNYNLLAIKATANNITEPDGFTAHTPSCAGTSSNNFRVYTYLEKNGSLPTFWGSGCPVKNGFLGIKTWDLSVDIVYGVTIIYRVGIKDSYTRSVGIKIAQDQSGKVDEANSLNSARNSFGTRNSGETLYFSQGYITKVSVPNPMTEDIVMTASVGQAMYGFNKTEKYSVGNGSYYGEKRDDLAVFYPHYYGYDISTISMYWYEYDDEGWLDESEVDITTEDFKPTGSSYYYGYYYYDHAFGRGDYTINYKARNARLYYHYYGSDTSAAVSINDGNFDDATTQLTRFNGYDTNKKNKLIQDIYDKVSGNIEKDLGDVTYNQTCRGITDGGNAPNGQTLQGWYLLYDDDSLFIPAQVAKDGFVWGHYYYDYWWNTPNADAQRTYNNKLSLPEPKASGGEMHLYAVYTLNEYTVVNKYTDTAQDMKLWYNFGTSFSETKNNNFVGYSFKSDNGLEYIEDLPVYYSQPINLPVMYVTNGKTKKYVKVYTTDGKLSKNLSTDKYDDRAMNLLATGSDGLYVHFGGSDTGIKIDESNGTIYVCLNADDAMEMPVYYTGTANMHVYGSNTKDGVVNTALQQVGNPAINDAILGNYDNLSNQYVYNNVKLLSGGDYSHYNFVIDNFADGYQLKLTVNYYNNNGNLKEYTIYHGYEDGKDESFGGDGDVFKTEFYTEGNKLYIDIYKVGYGYYFYNTNTSAGQFGVDVQDADVSEPRKYSMPGSNGAGVYIRADVETAPYDIIMQQSTYNTTSWKLGDAISASDMLAMFNPDGVNFSDAITGNTTNTRNAKGSSMLINISGAMFQQIENLRYFVANQYAVGASINANNITYSWQKDPAQMSEIISMLSQSLTVAAKDGAASGYNIDHGYYKGWFGLGSNTLKDIMFGANSGDVLLNTSNENQAALRAFLKHMYPTALSAGGTSNIFESGNLANISGNNPSGVVDTLAYAVFNAEFTASDGSASKHGYVIYTYHSVYGLANAILINNDFNWNTSGDGELIDGVWNSNIHLNVFAVENKSNLTWNLADNGTDQTTNVAANNGQNAGKDAVNSLTSANAKIVVNTYGDKVTENGSIVKDKGFGNGLYNYWGKWTDIDDAVADGEALGSYYNYAGGKLANIMPSGYINFEVYTKHGYYVEQITIDTTDSINGENRKVRYIINFNAIGLQNTELNLSYYWSEYLVSDSGEATELVTSGDSSRIKLLYIALNNTDYQDDVGKMYDADKVLDNYSSRLSLTLANITSDTSINVTYGAYTFAHISYSPSAGLDGVNVPPEDLSLRDAAGKDIADSLLKNDNKLLDNELFVYYGNNVIAKFTLGYTQGVRLYYTIDMVGGGAGAINLFIANYSARGQYTPEGTEHTINTNIDVEATVITNATYQLQPLDGELIQEGDVAFKQFTKNQAHNTGIHNNYKTSIDSTYQDASNKTLTYNNNAVISLQISPRVKQTTITSSVDYGDGLVIEEIADADMVGWTNEQKEAFAESGKVAMAYSNLYNIGDNSKDDKGNPTGGRLLASKGTFVKYAATEYGKYDNVQDYTHYGQKFQHYGTAFEAAIEVNYGFELTSVVITFAYASKKSGIEGEAIISLGEVGKEIKVPLKTENDDETKIITVGFGSLTANEDGTALLTLDIVDANAQLLSLHFNYRAKEFDVTYNTSAAFGSSDVTLKEDGSLLDEFGADLTSKPENYVTKRYVYNKVSTLEGEIYNRVGYNLVGWTYGQISSIDKDDTGYTKGIGLDGSGHSGLTQQQYRDSVLSLNANTDFSTASDLSKKAYKRNYYYLLSSGRTLRGEDYSNATAYWYNGMLAGNADVFRDLAYTVGDKTIYSSGVGHITMYAVWQAKTYNIDLDYNDVITGGVGSSTANKYTAYWVFDHQLAATNEDNTGRAYSDCVSFDATDYTLPLSTLATVKRLGYTFNGWYFNSSKANSDDMLLDGANSRDVGLYTGAINKAMYTAIMGNNGWSEGTYEATNTIKLYAKWTANNYSVIFDLNGYEGNNVYLTNNFIGQTNTLVLNTATGFGSSTANLWWNGTDITGLAFTITFDEVIDFEASGLAAYAYRYGYKFLGWVATRDDVSGTNANLLEGKTFDVDLLMYMMTNYSSAANDEENRQDKTSVTLTELQLLTGKSDLTNSVEAAAKNANAYEHNTSDAAIIGYKTTGNGTNNADTGSLVQTYKGIGGAVVVHAVWQALPYIINIDLNNWTHEDYTWQDANYAVGTNTTGVANNVVSPDILSLELTFDQQFNTLKAYYNGKPISYYAAGNAIFSKQLGYSFSYDETKTDYDNMLALLHCYGYQITDPTGEFSFNFTTRELATCQQNAATFESIDESSNFDYNLLTMLIYNTAIKAGTYYNGADGKLIDGQYYNLFKTDQSGYYTIGDRHLQTTAAGNELNGYTGRNFTLFTKWYNKQYNIGNNKGNSYTDDYDPNNENPYELPQQGDQYLYDGNVADHMESEDGYHYVYGDDADLYFVTPNGTYAKNVKLTFSRGDGRVSIIEIKTEWDAITKRTIISRVTCNTYEADDIDHKKGSLEFDFVYNTSTYFAAVKAATSRVDGTVDLAILSEITSAFTTFNTANIIELIEAAQSYTIGGQVFSIYGSDNSVFASYSANGLFKSADGYKVNYLFENFAFSISEYKILDDSIYTTRNTNAYTTIGGKMQEEDIYNNGTTTDVNVFKFVINYIKSDLEIEAVRSMQTYSVDYYRMIRPNDGQESQWTTNTDNPTSEADFAETWDNTFKSGWSQYLVFETVTYRYGESVKITYSYAAGFGFMGWYMYSGHTNATDEFTLRQAEGKYPVNTSDLVADSGYNALAEDTFGSWSTTDIDGNGVEREVEYVDANGQTQIVKKPVHIYTYNGNYQYYEFDRSAIKNNLSMVGIYSPTMIHKVNYYVYNSATNSYERRDVSSDEYVLGQKRYAQVNLNGGLGGGSVHVEYWELGTNTEYYRTGFAAIDSDRVAGSPNTAYISFLLQFITSSQLNDAGVKVWEYNPSTQTNDYLTRYNIDWTIIRSIIASSYSSYGINASMTPRDMALTLQIGLIAPYCNLQKDHQNYLLDTETIKYMTFGEEFIESSYYNGGHYSLDALIEFLGISGNFTSDQDKTMALLTNLAKAEDGTRSTTEIVRNLSVVVDRIATDYFGFVLKNPSINASFWPAGTYLAGWFKGDASLAEALSQPNCGYALLYDQEYAWSSSVNGVNIANRTDEDKNINGDQIAIVGGVSYAISKFYEVDQLDSFTTDYDSRVDNEIYVFAAFNKENFDMSVSGSGANIHLTTQIGMATSTQTGMYAYTASDVRYVVLNAAEREAFLAGCESNLQGPTALSNIIAGKTIYSSVENAMAAVGASQTYYIFAFVYNVNRLELDEASGQYKPVYEIKEGVYIIARLASTTIRVTGGTNYTPVDTYDR